MALQQVELNEAKAHLPDLVEAAQNGEEVIITKENRPVAKIVPINSEQRPHPQFGSARGMVQMADDFDAPLEEFREYME